MLRKKLLCKNSKFSVFAVILSFVVVNLVSSETFPVGFTKQLQSKAIIRFIDTNSLTWVEDKNPEVISRVPDNWVTRQVGDFNEDGFTDAILQDIWTRDYSIRISEDGESFKRFNVSYRDARPSEGCKLVSVYSVGSELFVPRYTPGTTVILAWQVENSGDVFLQEINLYDAGIHCSKLFKVNGVNGLGALVAISDWNLDDQIDFLFQKPTVSSNTVVMAYGKDSNGYSVGAYSTICVQNNPAWEVIGIKDFDKNGISDLVWQKLDTGQFGIWVINGNLQVTRTSYLPNPLEVGLLALSPRFDHRGAEKDELPLVAQIVCSEGSRIVSFKSEPVGFPSSWYSVDIDEEIGKGMDQDQLYEWTAFTDVNMDGFPEIVKKDEVLNYLPGLGFWDAIQFSDTGKQVSVGKETFRKMVQNSGGVWHGSNKIYTFGYNRLLNRVEFHKFIEKENETMSVDDNYQQSEMFNKLHKGWFPYNCVDVNADGTEDLLWVGCFRLDNNKYAPKYVEGETYLRLYVWEFTNQGDPGETYQVTIRGHGRALPVGYRPTSVGYVDTTDNGRMASVLLSKDRNSPIYVLVKTKEKEIWDLYDSNVIGDVIGPCVDIRDIFY